MAFNMKKENEREKENVGSGPLYLNDTFVYSV